MSKQRISVCIEGIPYVLGNDLPSWHAGTLDEHLEDVGQIRQDIDSLGGVATFGEFDFRIVDVLSAWARIFRVRQPREYLIKTPNPVEWGTDTLWFDVAAAPASLSVGDKLYAEQDTWTVTDAASLPEVTVTRQTYSCLQGGWRCRYQSGLGREHVVAVSPDGPITVMGRLVAVYVDGQLEYLGRIVDLTQVGRSWRVRCRDVLAIFQKAITAPGLGVRLRHPWNWSAAQWQAGTFEQSIAVTAPHGGTIEDLSARWLPGWNTIDPVPDNSWIFEPSSGMRWFGSAEPGEIITGGYYQGAVDALGSEWHYKTGIGNCTRPNGCAPYGVILTRSTLGGDYLEVSAIYYNGVDYEISQYVGAYLRIGNRLCRVSSVDTTNGYLYFDLIVSAADGELFPELSAGIASDTWIELPLSSIVQGATIQDAIRDVLAGTGQFGLGLPSGIIGDEPVSSSGCDSPVWWDWSKGGIDDDLRAQGLCLILRGGKIALRSCLPPIPQAATYTIPQADMARDGAGAPEIARGHEAPLAGITYQTKSREVTFKWTADTTITQSALRAVEMETMIGAEVTDESAWIRLQAMRLRWMYPGIPVVSFGLLADVLDIGDVVLIQSRYVAAEGHYLTQTLPALVIGRDPKAAQYTFAVNIGAVDQGACWAFAVEVSSAALAVITPTSQADLALFAAIVPVGTEVQLTEHDGTSVAWYGTIASYQATTVTLSSAPTIDADEIVILTCESIPGGSWNALVDRQVYAADASGSIDTTYPAKVLT